MVEWWWLLVVFFGTAIMMTAMTDATKPESSGEPDESTVLKIENKILRNMLAQNSSDNKSN
jgi:preprotein translocase subunit SecG